MNDSSLCLPPKFFVFLLFLLPSVAYAQFEKDFELFETVRVHTHQSPDFSAERQTHGTYKVVFTGIFLFYKQFISSQDANTCPFEVSCSLYFIRSVQQKGFIGFFQGIDRYMRCNGLSNSRYEIDPQTGKLIDPVE